MSGEGGGGMKSGQSPSWNVPGSIPAQSAAGQPGKPFPLGGKKSFKVGPFLYPNPASLFICTWLKAHPSPESKPSLIYSNPARFSSSSPIPLQPPP